MKVEALRSDGIVEAPTWFGPPERPLFGWHVYPDHGQVGGAVVLCPPLAEDGNKAHRTFREAARALAKEGLLAFRFDYDGTGDSAGSLNDAERRSAWIASVRAAVDEVRASGVPSVSILGMRMGATIALESVMSEHLPVDKLLLWDPCISGAAYLREQQLLQSSWAPTEIDVDEGWVETPSYLFSPEAARDIRSFAVPKAVEESVAGRTIVFARSDRPRPKRLSDALPRDRSSWFDVDDQAALLDVPTIEATVPTQGLARVVSVLTEGERRATFDLRVDQRLTAEWGVAGRRVVETARFLGSESLLFGIVSSPVEPPVERRQVLFLNVASERHIGIGRMWTELARTLAAEGTVAIRMDQSGVGDSGLHADQRQDVVYDPAWIDDIPDAFGTGHSEHIVGVGVCSSAVSALQAADSGALQGVVLVSAGLHFTHTVLSDRWTVVTQRDRWLKKLSIKHARVALLLESLLAAVIPRRHPYHSIFRVVRRGIFVALISGTEDAARMRGNVALSKFLEGRIVRSGRFRVDVLPGIDHSLRLSASRATVTAQLTELLVSGSDHPERVAAGPRGSGG